MSKGEKQESRGKKGEARPLNMEGMKEALGEEEEEGEEEVILPPAVQRRVNAMKNIHKDYLSLERKYKEEIAALDIKYEKLYAPYYLKQNAIALGEHEPTDAEAHVEGEDPAVDSDDKIDEDVKGIPKFWLAVLQNNPAIGETITDDDEDALSYLRDIRCTLYENSQGFEITFHFAENPYFSDSVLTKKYFLSWDDGIYADAVYDHSEGSTVNWKQGKNLTIKLVKKPQKNKGGKGKKGGAARVSVVEEPCDSFFHFFSTLPKPDEGEEEEGALDNLEQDFEIGCIIKDKLIPHSVLWFTGEALDYEEDEFGDYDDYDFEGEEGEEEEEEEEEEKPRKNPRTGKKGGDGKPFQLQPPSGHNGPAQPQQPECKQQ